jgi:putative NADH-flavin reductase
MRIVVFGASGRAGSRIVTELLNRGHSVTAVVRDFARLEMSHKHLSLVLGNVLDANQIRKISTGHDAVVNATGPRLAGDTPQGVIEAAHALIEGLKSFQSIRLIVLGGAGSLEVSPGKLLMTTPDFPEAWKPVAFAHKQALDVYKKSKLAWTYLSPAALLEPGERKGTYRTGLDQLLTDDKGESKISMEDLAIAIADEIENPAHIHERFAVAY